jgi:hypothetical protein
LRATDLRGGVRGGPRASARPVPTTAIIATTLVSEWLVEIEVIAAG